MSATMSELLTFLKRNTLAGVGLAVLLVLVVAIVFGPMLIGYSPIKLDILHKLQPP